MNVAQSWDILHSLTGRWWESIWKAKNAVYGPNHKDVIFSVFSVKPWANKAPSPARDSKFVPLSLCSLSSRRSTAWILNKMKYKPMVILWRCHEPFVMCVVQELQEVDLVAGDPKKENAQIIWWDKRISDQPERCSVICPTAGWYTAEEEPKSTVGGFMFCKWFPGRWFKTFFFFFLKTGYDTNQWERIIVYIMSHTKKPHKAQRSWKKQKSKPTSTKRRMLTALVRDVSAVSIEQSRNQPWRGSGWRPQV